MTVLALSSRLPSLATCTYAMQCRIPNFSAAAMRILFYHIWSLVTTNYIHEPLPHAQWVRRRRLELPSLAVQYSAW